MKERATFLTLLLFAELTLAVTVGLLPGEALRHTAMLAAMTLPLLFLRRAPAGTPALSFCPVSRRAALSLLLLPAFILTVAGVSLAWGWLAELLGLKLSGARPVEPLFLAILLDAAVPAIGEELFMRGAVYSTLRPLGRRTAILGSAILFALMHVSLAQLPYAFVAGVLLAALYELTGSLLYPILFHFGSNLFSLLLMSGPSPLFLLLSLAGMAAIGVAIFLALMRGVPLPSRTGGENPISDMRALLLSPLSLWLAAVLALMLL